jgi:hypothetical protein
LAFQKKVIGFLSHLQLPFWAISEALACGNREPLIPGSYV